MEGYFFLQDNIYDHATKSTETKWYFLDAKLLLFSFEAKSINEKTIHIANACNTYI